MAKTHPHIESPTPTQLRSLVLDRSEALVQTYLALHEILVSALADVVYLVDEVDASVGYGAHQYGYNGWGMAALTPYTKWVSLTLLHGAQLPDPEGLLTGTAQMRHVKLKHPDEVAQHSEALKSLVQAAAQLHNDVSLDNLSSKPVS